MPKNNENLEQLDLITHRPSSKYQKILALFDTIQQATEHRLSIGHIVNLLKQHNISISENTLRVYLYRIRKKRGSKANEVKRKEELREEQFQTGFEYWKALLKQISYEKEDIERYVLLGGERGDIESKTISEQRMMVTLLKIKLSNKYKSEG